MRRVLSIVLVITICLLVGFPAAGRGVEPALRGVVVDDRGRPLEGARVWLRSPRGGCFFVPGRSYVESVTPSNGTFELPVPSQSMEIYVEHPDHAPGWAEATRDATIRLEEPAWITGDLPEGAILRVSRGVFPCATLRTAGEFRCGPLPPEERLTVVVDSPRHRLWRHEVVLGRGEVRPLFLRLDGGVALDGQLVPARAGVELRASQGEARQSIAVSREDGSFRLTGLRDGAVRVLALFPDREPSTVRAVAGEFIRVEWAR